MSKKIKHLVVDTTAFIKAENLQEYADEICSIQEVIDEILNDRQRRKLVVLPYDLIVKDVFPEYIKIVSEFAKKTGDYTSLSATDIKVMALTYQLENEINGSEHLRKEPTMQKTIKVTGLPRLNTTESEKPTNTEEILDKNNKTDSISSINKPNNKQDVELTNDLPESRKIVQEDADIAEQIKHMNLLESEVEEIMVKLPSNDEASESDSQDETEDDSDGGEWITPDNVKEKKKEMDMTDFFNDKIVDVACITSDFAMQNVLKQIGLNVTAVDGRIIKQLRTFIFRCTTCFKTTSVMTKLFCPKCGHATLRKVAVSVDEEGNQHIHINGRKPLTTRGKKFSLPTPKGGQHFQYPILTEDQHLHKRFVTKQARNKTNPLDPEYTAGFSPFVMRDVNSKSAVLGIRADKQDVKYWMKNFSKGKK